MPAETSYAVGYEYTDSLGCFASVTEQVYIHTLPTITMSQPADICENGSVVVLDIAQPTGGTYFINDVAITAVNPAEIGFGSHSVSYVYTDAFGCESSAHETLEIRGIPVPDIRFTSSCLNNGVTIQNLSGAPGSVVNSTVWNIEEVGTITTLSPNNIHFSSPGEHSIAATLQTPYGCTQTWDSTITIWTLPTAQFSVSDGCQNSDLLFVNTSFIQEGSIVSNLWLAEGNSIEEEDTLHYAFSGWGDIDMTLVTTSDMGCSDTLTRTVNVYPLPQAQIEVSNTCDEQVVEFVSNASIPVGGIAGFNWSFGDDYAPQTGQDASLIFHGPGNYTATLEMISNMGCVYELHKNVTVYPLPAADFLLEEQVVCSNETIHLVDMSSVPSPHALVGWEWKFGAQVVSHSRNPEVLFEYPGVWDITLEVRSESGCVSDTTIANALRINPSPVAGFTMNGTDLIMPSPEVQVTNAASADVIEWTYVFGDGTTEHFESGSHLYLETGPFTVTQFVQNSFGCYDRMSVEINVTPSVQVFIPNAFTPDNNTHNEVYHPVFYGDDLTLYEFIIYDRWGTKVFETTDPTASWNGTYLDGSSIAPDGSYSWKLTYRGTVDPIIHATNGSVVLLR
jgi:gliding motility-associated-like protein